jgi:hypothetical protein
MRMLCFLVHSALFSGDIDSAEGGPPLEEEEEENEKIGGEGASSMANGSSEKIDGHRDRYRNPREFY